jgi:hypothetical protein
MDVLVALQGRERVIAFPEKFSVLEQKLLPVCIELLRDLLFRAEVHLVKPPQTGTRRPSCFDPRVCVACTPLIFELGHFAQGRDDMAHSAASAAPVGCPAAACAYRASAQFSTPLPFTRNCARSDTPTPSNQRLGIKVVLFKGSLKKSRLKGSLVPFGRLRM